VLVGDCRARVLNPVLSLGGGVYGNDGKRLNNQSVMLHLRCGKSAFLFTGDVEREAEAWLTERGEDLEAAVLKVPHHGARGSVYPPFLGVVKPRVAVVSVGRANAYGHPSRVMLEAYAGLGISILRTDLHGAVTVTETDAGLQVSCESGRRLRRVKLWEGLDNAEVQNMRRLFSERGTCGVAA